MAILRGFPPSNTISPSVRIAEKDLSLVPANPSFHRAGLVGFASKGPINIPTLIRTRQELNSIFGFPHPEAGDPYLIYAAEQYLLVANELYVVRVAVEDAVDDEQATTAEVDIPSAGGQIIITSDTPDGATVDADGIVTAGGYSFSVDSFFRWRLNGVLSQQTLVVLADANRPSPLTGTAYTCLQLVEDLNLQINVDNGISFFCTTDDEIGVLTLWAFGPDSELELVSVQNAIYGGELVSAGGTNVTGLGTGMEPAQVAGTADNYPTTGSMAIAGSWDFTGLTNLNLQIVIDGTDSTTIDNVVQVVDLEDLEGGVWTTAQVVTEINVQIASLPGGFQAVGGGIGPAWHPSLASDRITLITDHAGRDARMLVKSDSTADLIFGLSNLTAVGVSPRGTSGDADIEELGIVNGDANDTGAVTFTVTADSPGIDGDNTQVVITNDTRDAAFTIDIYNNGLQVEVWGNLTKDETSRFYVETFIALVSDWILVEDNTSNPASPLDGTYNLVGGSDGIPADPDDQDDLLIGNIINMSGVYALADPEQIEIDLIAIPGHPSTAVIEAMIDVCQNQRADCLAIVDPPFGLTVDEIVAWQNGTHPLNTTRLNSDFAALYWPWVKIRDTFNNVDVWAPPSGSILAVYARSDQLGAPWLAPAGVERGAVPGITDIYTRANLAERDLMYGFRNAINPITRFTDVDGFLVWGQKTLQRAATALDRVNVRRMLFVAEKRIRSASKNLLFEPHDELFRQRFIDLATNILDEIRVGRGLTDFLIQADDELNTADVIDRNEFRARIGVQPTRAVEFIFIEFSIHRTGSFTESADSF
jgi:hypothetical protein